jgi:hypothetical protein
MPAAAPASRSKVGPSSRRTARTDHRTARQLSISVSPVGRNCRVSSLGSNAVARHKPERGQADRLTSHRGNFRPGGNAGGKIGFAEAFSCIGSTCRPPGSNSTQAQKSGPGIRPLSSPRRWVSDRVRPAVGGTGYRSISNADVRAVSKVRRGLALIHRAGRSLRSQASPSHIDGPGMTPEPVGVAFCQRNRQAA